MGKHVCFFLGGGGGSLPAVRSTGPSLVIIMYDVYYVVLF